MVKAFDFFSADDKDAIIFEQIFMIEYLIFEVGLFWINERHAKFVELGSVVE